MFYPLFSQCDCAKSFGGFIDDYVGDLTSVNDGFILSVGENNYPSNDAQLYKFDFNCNLIWQNNTGFIVRTIIKGDGDNFYGMVYSEYKPWYDSFTWQGVTLYPGRTLVKFNKDGDPIWSRKIDGHGYVVEKLFFYQNEIFYTGTFGGTININDEITFSNNFSNRYDRHEAFIAKFSVAGNLIDAKKYGDGSSEYIKSEIDNLGNIYFARVTVSGKSSFLDKIDKNLNILITKEISKSQNNSSAYIPSNLYFNEKDDNLYVWGAFSQTTYLENNYFDTGSTNNAYFQTILSSFSSSDLNLKRFKQINNNAFGENPIRDSYTNPWHVRGGFMKELNGSLYVFTSFSNKFEIDNNTIFSTQTNSNYYNEDLIFLKFNLVDFKSDILFKSESVKSMFSNNTASALLLNNDDFYLTSNFASSPIIKLNNISINNSSGNGDSDVLLYKWNAKNIVNGNLSSNSPVCHGKTVNLKASGGTSYSWTGPNGFTSTQQNPTIPNATALNAGIYSCIISGTGGCDGTYTVEVKVEDKTAPIPDIANLPTITGNCKTVITTFPTATDNCAGTITGTTSDPLQYSLLAIILLFGLIMMEMEMLIVKIRM